MKHDRRSPPPAQLHRNVAAIGEVHQANEAHVGKHQRLVERVAQTLSQPATAYVLVIFAVGWIGGNLVAGGRAIDARPFFMLQGMVTFYAATVSTAVLVAQRRERRDAEKRAQLELQVNLLSEQKATKIIALLEELRRDLPEVANREDPEAAALEKRLDPHAVLSALESPHPRDSRDSFEVQSG